MNEPPSGEFQCSFFLATIRIVVKTAETKTLSRQESIEIKTKPKHLEFETANVKNTTQETKLEISEKIIQVCL